MRRLVLPLALYLVIFAGGADPWQNAYRHNEAGNDAIAQGDPEAAINAYTEALAAAPDDPTILYNLANAFAAAGRADEAQQTWQRAIEKADDPNLRRDAWFNRGVGAMNGQDLRNAIGSFAESLMIDPDDQDARRNLELALRQLRQQQQQQQQSSSDENDEGDENQQQQQQQQQNQQEDQQRQGDPQESDDPNEESNEPGEQNNQQEGSQPQPQQKPTGQGEPKDADRDMAERLLEMLDENEKDALKRALKRRAQSSKKSREKDW